MQSRSSDEAASLAAALAIQRVSRGVAASTGCCLSAVTSVVSLSTNTQSPPLHSMPSTHVGTQGAEERESGELGGRRRKREREGERDIVGACPSHTGNYKGQVLLAQV